MKLTLLSLILLTAFSSASEKVSFNFEVRPILSDKCFFCHGPDPENRESDLRLDTAEGAFKALKKGRFPIKPGAPEESHVWKRISTDDEDDIMPPPDSNLFLTDKEKQTIKKWIEQGAEYRKHWAFEPLPAKVKVPGTNESPIDAFIQLEMSTQGLKVAPLADKAILLRRAKMVLTGIPPTEKEIEQFLKDKSPNAYEKVIDSFLASPAFAEKMAVDWMDLSRFADTYGFQVDRNRDMTPWRDWVLKAFNKNMPFDKFITWQLAGDLIDNPTQDSIIATAFNRHHQQKVEGGSIEEEFRVEYVADRTHTAGTAFLGLTMECARCHDHKYDPISMKDYYRLFAFFNNIDEAGLYSYFTPAIPTPAIPVMDEKSSKTLKQLLADIQITEKKLSKIASEHQDDFTKWLQHPGELKVNGITGSYNFNDLKKGLQNQVKGPKGSGPARLINGATGKAFQLDGDKQLQFKLGTLDRALPMSLSIDLNIPKKMKRAVVVHKSKAWTDAASRGYELLIEDGRLSWAFIHFWPGDAIRIQTIEEIPLKTWTKITVTYDGSSTAAGLKLYLNGKAVKTKIMRDNLTRKITYGGDPNLQIGARMRDRGFTNGGVDNFMLFNRQLTEIEIEELQNPGTLKTAATKKSSNLYDYYLHNYNSEYLEALKVLIEKRRSYNNSFDKTQSIMVMKEMPERRQTYVLKRGLYSEPDFNQKVEPSGPAEIMPFDKSYPRNRLGLAKWLTNPSHPLTSRVTVNRFWRMVFGSGIVTTPDDFGSQGALPSHPKLLDWLCRDFIDSGWDVKAIIKKMVMSRTFRQSSATTAEQLKADPFNTWLGTGPRFRLTAEMIRDQALAAGDQLNTRFGGKSENADKSTRRGLYLFWKRSDPPPSMLIFDAPRRQVCSVKRETTSTPLQALVLLNRDFYIKAAQSTAIAALQSANGNEGKTLDSIFMRLTGRKPLFEETKLLMEIYQEQLGIFKTSTKMCEAFLKVGGFATKWKNSDELAAWSVVASTIQNLDASITLR